MNDLILTKMREGDWGEVVRLMRAEYGGSSESATVAPKEEPKEMPFHERFETVRITPQTVADSVVEENGRFTGLLFEGDRYKPSRRFLKGLAQRMKVSLSVFELFSPLEVVRRAGLLVRLLLGFLLRLRGRVGRGSQGGGNALSAVDGAIARMSYVAALLVEKRRLRILQVDAAINNRP